MRHIFTCFLTVVFILESTAAVAGKKHCDFLRVGAMSDIVNAVEAKGFFLEKDINEKVKRFSKGEINFQYYLSGQSGFPICYAINIVLTKFDLS